MSRLNMGFTLSTVQLAITCLQKTPTLRRQMGTGIFIQARSYSRWAHRKPVRIVNEKDIFEEEEASAPRNILKDARFAFKQRQKLKQEELTKPVAPKARDGTLDDDGAPIFTKLEKDDKIMSTLMLTVKSRKKQKQDDRMLLEGHRLIEDAMKVGLVPEIIIFSRKMQLQKLPLPKTGVKLYKIPYRTIQLWSDLTTSPGIMGIFKTPDISARDPADDAIPVTIICDNVREPGNMGAILRVAAGVGCERVILTKGCVDLWSPKVLRSAAGAHFRLPIFRSQTWPEVQYLISENANIFVADNNVKSPSDADVPDSSSSSDSDSDSDSSDSEAEPDSEAKDIVKKIREDFGEKSCGDDSPPPESKKIVKKKAYYQDVENIPVIPYFAARYANTESIIIIGGETEGLSEESLSLALRRDGVRVNVPLTNGVDSLNTGTALGVILFEVKRQFLIGTNMSNT